MAGRNYAEDIGKYLEISRRVTLNNSLELYRNN